MATLSPLIKVEMTQIHPDIRKMYEEIQGHIKTINDVQQQKTKLIETRQQLGSQKNENDLVHEELQHLEAGSAVYKLIGPALVAQDVADAKVMVEKRLERISDSIKATDASIEQCDRKEADVSGTVVELQRKMQERYNQITAASQKAQTA